MNRDHSESSEIGDTEEESWRGDGRRIEEVENVTKISTMTEVESRKLLTHPTYSVLIRVRIMKVETMSHPRIV